MYNTILKVLTSVLKQVKPDVPIYSDDVMQSDKPFYFVIALEEGSTANVGITVQNKAYLVDIALIDNRNDKKLIKDPVERCGAFFNVVEIDGNQLFPEDYLPYESNGVQHVGFTLAFPQKIEWSEE